MIDYQAIAEQLQHENERLRMRIVSLRVSRSPLHNLDAYQVKTFVEKNYILILAGCLIFSMVVAPTFDMVVELFKKNSKE